MSKLRFIVSIYALGLVAIPYFVISEILAGRWDPKRVDLKKFWRALER